MPYPNSTNYAVAKDQITYTGLLAQEAEETMQELIIKEHGYIDGIKVDDMRRADYTPLMFALVNAVKELKALNEQLAARVAALEA